MKLTDHIFLIASGSAGISLTHDNDCNAYAIDCGSGFVLIDCGAGIDPSRIYDEMVSDGVAPISNTHLLLTHYHLDHCGGARWFRDQVGLQVFASAETARAVSSGDEEAISLAAAKLAGVYPSNVHLTPCTVDRVLSPGDRWMIGDVEFEAIATPGHSRDMLSYLVRRDGRTDLFCGDTLFYGGRVLLSSIHDCDAAALCHSLRELASHDFEGLFPGHGLWSLRDGRRHAAAAMKFVDRLSLPPSL